LAVSHNLETIEAGNDKPNNIVIAVFFQKLTINTNSSNGSNSFGSIFA